MNERQIFTMAMSVLVGVVFLIGFAIYTEHQYDGKLLEQGVVRVFSNDCNCYRPVSIKDFKSSK